MNKAKFFAEMKECRVNASAFITIQGRKGGKTALVMQQSGAPNAFLSMHKDGSDAMKKAWDKYEAWLKEYFMELDEIIAQDHVDAIEEDRQITALLAEADEVEMLHDSEKKDVIDLCHEAALVMNAEIDDLSQRLADRRVYWSSPQAIHNSQQHVLIQYRKDAFKNGPRIVQHVVKVMIISIRRAKILTGYAEIAPDPKTLIDIDECEIPF